MSDEKQARTRTHGGEDVVKTRRRLERGSHEESRQLPEAGRGEEQKELSKGVLSCPHFQNSENINFLSSFLFFFKPPGFW